MLFCHPIVSELCIMCQALFRSLQFPPKYGPWPDSNNSADGTWPTTSKWHVCIDKLSQILEKERKRKQSTTLENKIGTFRSVLAQLQREKQFPAF